MPLLCICFLSSYSNWTCWYFFLQLYLSGFVTRLTLHRLMIDLVRYLQQPVSPTDRAPCNYHFFNTYFYKKLKEALSYKVHFSTCVWINSGPSLWQRVNFIYWNMWTISSRSRCYWRLAQVPSMEENSYPSKTKKKPRKRETGRSG